MKGSPYGRSNPVRKINNITYIKEPTGYLCGQSCVAMLAGVSVDEVIRIIGTAKGTNKQELKKALDYYGICYAPKSTKYDPNIPLPCLCIIRMMVEKPPDIKYGYWGIYYNGTYYDPEFGISDKSHGNTKVFQIWEIYV